MKQDKWEIARNGTQTQRRIKLVFAITAIRIPLAILFSLMVFNLEQTWKCVAIETLLLALIELSDFLDGFLARKWGVVTELGALFDPFADSTSRLVLFGGLAFAGLAVAIVPLIMALRDITVAYSRIAMAAKDISVSAKLSGKIKAVVQGVASFILVLGPHLLFFYDDFHIKSIVSWLVILVTAFSAIEYVMGGTRALRQGK
ncbi:MAG: hypothetical protein CSA81_09625 [Acidobacteria bacterium]|nr:MAG: hypothetical protein CSA81_09625 [Acidobacteriota bacterium]